MLLALPDDKVWLLLEYMYFSTNYLYFDHDNKIIMHNGIRIIDNTTYNVADIFTPRVVHFSAFIYIGTLFFLHKY